MKRTHLGFPYVDFEDHNGAKCSIQQTDSAILLGIDVAIPKIFRRGEGWQDLKLPQDALVSGHMRLTQEQVLELLPILYRFAETGRLEDGGMTGRWELTINEASPSRNLFFHKHWSVEYHSKMRWLALIRAAPGFLGIPKATGKRRLTIERHGRHIDPDNLIGGAKGIIDNLVALKLLVDDNEKYVESHGKCIPLTRGKKPKTVLILEDIEGLEVE